VGVPLQLLPPVMPAHQVLGRVTREAAVATGIAEGTPVVAGGGDFASSALGAGVIEEGEACLMLGTAGNLLLPMKQPRFDARLLNSHHVGCDRWLALGGTLCGAALEWFRRACAPGATWEALEAEAAAVEVGAGGVVMLPYLQGERTPIWDERARGAFFGLELTHGRGHLFRALLEGIALGFRDCLAVAEQNGTRLTSVVAANGAGKSPLLRQILADALGVPLTWSSGGGATVAGAALLAGMGIGVVGDASASRAWSQAQPKKHHHDPDPRSHVRLEAVLEQRRALHTAESAARRG
jgi:xylulokinase